MAGAGRAGAGVFSAGLALDARSLPTAQKKSLIAEQRGWIKGRNDCWKSDDRRSCVEQAYRLRIAELQARYRLVPAVAEARYVCDDSPGSELLVTFFQTDPASLIAERGDSNSLMSR